MMWLQTCWKSIIIDFTAIQLKMVHAYVSIYRSVFTLFERVKNYVHFKHKCEIVKIIFHRRKHFLQNKFQLCVFWCLNYPNSNEILHCIRMIMMIIKMLIILPKRERIINKQKHDLRMGTNRKCTESIAKSINGCSLLRHIFICIHAFQLVAQNSEIYHFANANDEPKCKKSAYLHIDTKRSVYIDTCLIVSIAAGIAWIILLNFTEFHTVVLPTIFLRHIQYSMHAHEHSFYSPLLNERQITTDRDRPNTQIQWNNANRAEYHSNLHFTGN